MEFRNRRLIKYEDLNPRGTLFGGKILLWIDEEAAIYVRCQLGTEQVVTKCMSEINFVSPGRLGDVIEIGIDLVQFGKTSITVKCEVRNKTKKQMIITIDKIVFVCVDEKGKPKIHGITNETK